MCIAVSSGNTIRGLARGSSAFRRTTPRAVLADNGFQDWHTEYELSALDLDYLVHHRGSTPMAAAHNALKRAKGYTQRWMAETSYSTTKRTQDSALRSRFWYRQFREIVLMFAIYNIKKITERL